uniref:Ig-like domain-containing protein n=1 Tax=Salmo trutta TaxID=8032 RepID=A0A673ZG97_SALTR
IASLNFHYTHYITNITLPLSNLSFHLFHISVVTTTSLQPREVAAPGSDFTLNCSFPSSKNLNHLVINWQRGESEVVHSYYHGRDQLERQSGVYKGRTHLFEDQLAVGNASLRLSGVQPSDQGPYTCDVTDEQGSTQENLFLDSVLFSDTFNICLQFFWNWVFWIIDHTVHVFLLSFFWCSLYLVHLDVMSDDTILAQWPLTMWASLKQPVSGVHNTLLQFMIKPLSDIEGNVAYFSD